MKIKMNEYLQGSGVSALLVRTGDNVNILTPNEVYEVGSSLAEFILSNRKGVKVEEVNKPVIDVQVKEPVEVVAEVAESKPVKKFGRGNK